MNVLYVNHGRSCLVNKFWWDKHIYFRESTKYKIQIISLDNIQYLHDERTAGDKQISKKYDNDIQDGQIEVKLWKIAQNLIIMTYKQ